MSAAPFTTRRVTLADALAQPQVAQIVAQARHAMESDEYGNYADVVIALLDLVDSVNATGGDE